MECRYLSQEARSMASCLMDSQSVPPEVTERAIQQALVLGVMSGTAIDVSTFESLFDAVVLEQAAGTLATTIDADHLAFLILSIAGWWSAVPQVARMFTGPETDAGPSSSSRYPMS